MAKGYTKTNKEIQKGKKMITLDSHEIQLQISPEKGASLFSLKYDGLNVLRPTGPNASIPQDYSLFIMLPYCSYIQNGHFNYFGITRTVQPNQSNSNTPIHGDGWLSSWRVEQQTSDNATLTYTHNKESGFPFNYTASVTYKIINKALQITLSLINPSDLPMPCGMGIHPYFVEPDKAQLAFNSTHIWHHKNDPIFDRPYPTPEEWNFSKSLPITQDFDTAFGGWDGKASIVYPSEKIKIDITAEDIFHHIVLYHPKKADFFCLEPVSNTPDAFNLAAYGVIGTGIQSIGAKQTLTKTIIFSCEEL